MRKLKSRKVKGLAQGHTASKMAEAGFKSRSADSSMHIPDQSIKLFLGLA
jgi:hypothetical protein